MRWLPAALLLCACDPPDPAESCAAYAASLLSCYEAADVPVPEGSTEAELCPAETLLAGEAYLCMETVYAGEEANCGTPKGLTAIAVDLDRCL